MARKKTKQLVRNRMKPRQRNANSSMPAVEEYLCSVTDPFCDHAQGAVSPYGTKQYTMPFTVRSFSTIGTGAGGQANVVFQPGMREFNFHADTVAVASTFTAAAGYNTSSGALPTFLSQGRVISAGVRWWNILAATAAGGSVTVVPVPDDSELLDGAAHSWASLNNTPGAVTTSLRADGAYIFKRVDVPLSYEFTDITSGSGAPADNGWDAVLLNITGPASTNVLIIEWYLRCEGVFDATQSQNAGSVRPPRPYAINFQQFAPAGFMSMNKDRIRAYFQQKAKEYFLKYGKKLAITAGNYVLPGAGSAIGMLTDNIPNVD